MDDKTLEMEAIHNLLKEVKQNITNFDNLKCTSIELIISSEKENPYDDLKGFYIKFNSINPENGKKYVVSDVVDKLDKEFLIKFGSVVQRNTIAKHELMCQS